MPAHPKTPDPSSQEESQHKENKPPAVTFMLELTREELLQLVSALGWITDDLFDVDPLATLQTKARKLLEP